MRRKRLDNLALGPTAQLSNPCPTIGQFDNLGPTIGQLDNWTILVQLSSSWQSSSVQLCPTVQSQQFDNRTILVQPTVQQWPTLSNFVQQLDNLGPTVQQWRRASTARDRWMWALGHFCPIECAINKRETFLSNKGVFLFNKGVFFCSTNEFFYPTIQQNSFSVQHLFFVWAVQYIKVHLGTNAKLWSSKCVIIKTMQNNGIKFKTSNFMTGSTNDSRSCQWGFVSRFFNNAMITLGNKGNDHIGQHLEP